MTIAIVAMELRLRARSILSAAIGLIALTTLVGALFPALSDSIGNLKVGEGVGNLIGGGDLSTIAGWLRAEIVSVYGPVVFAGVAIAAAAATTAGEEEDRILALILAHPVPRSRLLLAKAAAIALQLVVLAIAVFAGMRLGVALAGGGLATSHLATTTLHLLSLGLTVGALALTLGAGTGRRSLAVAVPAALTLAMYLVNGLAPTIDAIAWLKYLTVFHYYEGHDPLSRGADLGGVAVLATTAALLTATAVAAFARRDLRA